jgi:hypothetical protein
MIKRMVKLDLSVLTFLCVRNFDLNFDHLLALTKIDSLAVLVLERAVQRCRVPDQEMSSKDILSWGRSVCESGAFQRLKVLLFGDYIPERRDVLKAASQFPSLTLVGVMDYLASYSDHPVIEGSYRGWCPADAESEGNAALIWADRTTTKTQKMERQYQLSRKLSQSPSTALNPERSISIRYYPDEWLVEEDKVLWYCRELGDSVTQSVKRSVFADQRDDRNSSGSKKRKVRDDKRMDVGSILNSFI